jgi:hypothetical protein
LLSEASTFYDAEMISQLTNAMLHNYRSTTKYHTRKPTIECVTASEVNYVMRQLKTTPCLDSSVTQVLNNIISILIYER